MITLPSDVLKNCIIPYFDNPSLEAFHRTCRKYRMLTASRMNQLTFQKLYGTIAPSEVNIPVLKLKERIFRFLNIVGDGYVFTFDKEGHPFYAQFPFERCANSDELWKQKVKFFKGEYFIKVYEEARKVFVQLEKLGEEIKMMPYGSNVGQDIRDRRKRLDIIRLIWSKLKRQMKDTLDVYNFFEEECLNFFERRDLKVYLKPNLKDHIPFLDKNFNDADYPFKLDIIKFKEKPDIKIIYENILHYPNNRSILRLEEHGVYGYLNISREWKKEGTPLVGRKYPDQDSYLKVTNLVERCMHLKTLILQLALEIFLREKDEVLEFQGDINDPHFLILVGLCSMGKVNQSRSQKYIQDHKKINSCFFNFYKKEGKLCTRQGEEVKVSLKLNSPSETWDSIIAKRPLLKGSGPLLPIFF